MIYNLFCLVTFANLLVLSSGASPARPPQRCRRYEVPVQCENACQPTCRDPNRQPCPTFVCNPGCACAPGYIRSNDGRRCIRRDYCPGGSPNITCGLNEVPKKCYEPCPPTCGDPNRIPCPTLRCSEGCECAPGFIRIRDGGDCVPQGRCPIIDPPLCPTNQTYKTSGFDCNTCRIDVSVGCAEIQEHKCYCNDGYVRLRDGNCVLRDDCPDREKCDCTRGFSFAICGNCDNNCASIGKPPAPCACIPGCACTRPYRLESESYTCIPEENCPPM